MATRQEMVCAINLIRHTARANKHLESLTKVLDGTIALIDEEKKPLLFEEKKKVIESNREVLYDLTNRIKVVTEKADPIFLDNGIADVAFRVAGVSTHYLRNDIASDVDNVNAVCTQAKEPLSLATNEGIFETIAMSFKSTNQKTGLVEPDPWELFPNEVNHANILHDILDALSYELQGRNSNTGELYGLTSQQRDKLFNNRIFTANLYLSKLPDNEDKQELGGILSYVETNISKINYTVIGKYIDENLSKLIMVRRGWAL